MRLPTRRVRDRINPALGPILATLLAFGSTALGDEPAKDKDKDEVRDALLYVVGSGMQGAIERVSGPVDRAFGVIDFLLRRPDKNPWLDATVVLKSTRAELLVDGKPVPRPDGRSFHKFEVKKIEPTEDGDRLYLVDSNGKLKGWVKVSEVVREKEAGAYFSDMIGREPASAEAYYLRGAFDKDRSTPAKDREATRNQALADLTEAIRLDPKFAEALVARGSLYAGKKDYDRALADLTEAIRLDPDRVAAYQERAGVYEEKNDLARGIADLTEAIRLDPGDYSNYASRGMMHHNNEAWDKGIADLTEAIRLGPKDDIFAVLLTFKFYLCRAQCHRQLKQYDPAIADLTEAIRLQMETIIPNKSTLFLAVYQRADAWDKKKDYDRAIEGFTDAIGRTDKPKSKAMAYAGRAKVRKHRKDVNGALADYAEALRHDPGPVVAAVTYINRGHIEADRNDIEGALADLAKAIEARPDSPFAYAHRGQILADNGRYERALADSDRAVVVDPESPCGHHLRAWIGATCPEAKFRDGKKAVEEATRANELTGWKEPYYLEALAAAEAEAGDFDAAVGLQGRAIELATDADDEDRARSRDRLELYRDKKPYRDVPRADGGRRAGLILPEIPLTAR